MLVENKSVGVRARYANCCAFRESTYEESVLQHVNIVAEIIWDDRRSLPAVLFVAARRIRRGEELVVNYGSDYWGIVWKHLVRANFEFWVRVQPRCEALEKAIREKLDPNRLSDEPQLPY